jgi:hypothetical protein
MKNKMARVKWIMILVVAFVWKSQQFAGSGTFEHPIARITIEKVKKATSFLLPSAFVHKQSKARKSIDEVKEPLGLFTLLRF